MGEWVLQLVQGQRTFSTCLQPCKINQQVHILNIFYSSFGQWDGLHFCDGGGGGWWNIFCGCHMCEGEGYAHPQENVSVIHIKLMFDKLTYTFD